MKNISVVLVWQYMLTLSVIFPILKITVPLVHICMMVYGILYGVLYLDYLLFMSRIKSLTLYFYISL